MTKSYQQELDFALSLVRATARVVLQYFDQGVSVVAKSDGSPVTIADKEVENTIRNAIAQKYPDDSILGEEGGETTAEKASRKWIVDPIDGTYNFARHIPIWSTLIALESEGEIVMGVVAAPAMHECFYACKGQGAFKISGDLSQEQSFQNPRSIRVSDNDSLDKSGFNFGTPDRIHKIGKWDAFTRAVLATERQRGYGDYLGFAHVFEGKSEAMLETGVKPWDLAPMKIIVEEAGGIFFDLSGCKSIYPGSCIVSNKNVANAFKDIFVNG